MKPNIEDTCMIVGTIHQLAAPETTITHRSHLTFDRMPPLKVPPNNTCIHESHVMPPHSHSYTPTKKNKQNRIFTFYMYCF